MSELTSSSLGWLAEHPEVLMLSIFGPLILLAAVRKIFPTRWLAVTLAIPILLSGLLFLETDFVHVMGQRIDFVTAILLADFMIAAIALVDIWSLPRRKLLVIERSAQRVASLQKDHPVTLTLTNQSRRPTSLTVRDDCPLDCTAHPKEHPLHLPARSRATLRYDLRASRRGAFQLQYVYLRMLSRFGMWQHFRQHQVSTTLHVYPDMKQLAEYAILARTNRLSLVGVRRTRKIGQDNEFERLRDYTRDDNFKHIDWRTTARRRKLTVKDFQTNQSQRVVFLVDCGRMMTNESSGLSLLDHSLNAMLMLSYVALRQGDAVGMICFSDRIHSFVPPRGGLNQMNRMIHASFDRFPPLVESRYDQAFLYLSSHCRKRSLVVLTTNIIDEVNANQVRQYLSAAVGKHLPLGVFLRDHALFGTVERPLTSPHGIYDSAAAAEIITWRHEVIADLQHHGVLSIDAFPEDMTAPLVNRYLEIKARHLL
ncbi:MAG: DUF58 domain-containing protein [Pirellulaceae bacterium]